MRRLPHLGRRPIQRAESRHARPRAQGDGYPDLSTTVSQLFPGRAVAALAADPAVMERSGETVKASELAAEYGFTDIHNDATGSP